MNIKFLQDFQGRETQNRFYLKGQQAEFETDIAVNLIQNKFAVEVKHIEIREPEIEAVEDDPKPTKRGKK
jgi:hypothetical protein